MNVNIISFYLKVTNGGCVFHNKYCKVFFCVMGTLIETCKQTQLILLISENRWAKLILYFAGGCITLAVRLAQSENSPLFCFASWIPEHMDFATGELQEHRIRASAGCAVSQWETDRMKHSECDWLETGWCCFQIHICNSIQGQITFFPFMQTLSSK